MIYTRNGKYYLKRPEKMSLVNASLDDKGNVNLIPIGKSVPVSNTELALYNMITLDEIKAELTKKPEKVEKVEVKEPDNKFSGFFEKSTKSKKTI